MRLKHSQLKRLPEGRHADGAFGLYLNVDGGSRSWIQRVTIAGRRTNIGLGPWPVVGLAEARSLALDNARMIHHGDDPRTMRKRARNIPTFAESIEAYIAIQRAGWKRGSRNEANWRSSLAHAATLDARPVDAIDVDDVIGVLGALIGAGKAPTARALRQRMRGLFDWARAQGHRGDNPADERIDAMLPKNGGGHRVEHRASVDPGDVADVLDRVRAIPEPRWSGMKAALEFAVLTAARTSEVLGARWDEIDVQSATWTVPASRMKAGRDHRVPLSAAALSVLRAARERTGGDGLVFRSPRGGKLDSAALRRVLRRVESTGTVHGFRGAFKTWAMESGIERALAEFSLAHSFMGDVEAAYARSDLLEKRRPIMESWARFVTADTGA